MYIYIYIYIHIYVCVYIYIYITLCFIILYYIISYFINSRVCYMIIFLDALLSMVVSAALCFAVLPFCPFGVAALALCLFPAFRFTVLVRLDQLLYILLCDYIILHYSILVILYYITQCYITLLVRYAQVVIYIYI